MLLDEIIGLLSDEKATLEGALLKSKVLLHQIGHKDLAPWVNSELGGYAANTEVPSYRVVRSEVHGSLTVGLIQYPDAPLPVYHLEPGARQHLTQTKMPHSIGSLEEHIRTYRRDRKPLVRLLPPELFSRFQAPLAEETVIHTVWCVANMTDIESIPVQVRSRLLDFCLELHAATGGEAEPQQLHKKAIEVDAGKMFQTIIYGGNVYLGAHQNIQVNNQRGDIEGLINEVKKLGYEQKDLDELRQAVVDDKATGKTPDISDGKTGGWFIKALKKAGEGVVKGGIEIATKVIVESLKHYTGAGS